ncbi:hypothetical protein AAHH76_12395 [Bacillus toyonensis]
MKVLTKVVLSIFLFATFSLETPINVLAQDNVQGNVQEDVKVIYLTEDEIKKFKEEQAKRLENNIVEDSTKHSRTKRSAVAGAGALGAFVGETFGSQA